MSEAKRNVPREVPNTDSVAARLAEFSNVFIKYVAGYPVPVSPKFRGDHRCNARDLRALNWAHMTRAASVANSNVTRGAQKDLSDAEKVAWLTKYINEDYEFTNELGSEFNESLLDLAISRVVFALGVEQGKRTGVYKDYAGTAEYAKDEAKVTKIKSDPMLADRYEPLIRNMISTILSERAAVQTRKSAAASVEDIEL